KQAFTQSEAAATVAAMNYLKVPVKIVVAQVLKDAPATGVVKAEDIITSVDGKDVSEPGQVQELVRAKKPGDRMELGIERKGKKLTEEITLGSHPDDDSVALLGISMTSQPKEDIKVQYNLQDIGGPSAGMMFTLAVIDKLSEGELNGGKFVAGTGTINEDGTVGPIGGIVHKVEASKQAGAELFLAPADNCAEATSRDTGDMVVAKVESIDDAIVAMDNFAHGKKVETCG
ncbi:PDZ domain-containing protein, partial [Corynebacterium striatum]